MSTVLSPRGHPYQCLRVVAALFAAIAVAAVGFAGPLAGLPVVTLPVGAGPEQVSVNVASNGQILDGPFQGPTAVCALGDRFVVADTLAARVLIVERPGKVARAIALEPLAKQAGLATTPAIVDVIPLGSPTSSLAIADAANLRIIVVGLDGLWQKTLPATASDAARLASLGRLHAGKSNTLYVEDVAGRQAVRLDANGKVEAVLAEALAIAGNAEGQLIQPVFRGDAKSRDLCALDEQGQPGFVVGLIEADTEIKLIRPLRMLPGGDLVVWYALASDEVIVAIEPGGKSRELWRGTAPSGPEMTTPFVVDDDGAVYVAQASAAKWQLLRVSRAGR